MIHFDDPIVNRDVGLEGRDKELCKPLLQLFHGTRVYNEVKTTLMSFLDKKNKRKKNTSIDPVLYEIAVNLVSARGEKIYNSAIWQAIQDNIPGADIDPKKPNEYQSYEYETIYRKTAIKIIESFGAEPDRDHNGRFLKFDLHTLAKTAKQFDIDISLQSKLDDAINTSFHRHIVTASRSKNDINITGNDEADKEITEESVQSDNKQARDGVTVVTVAVQEKPSIYRIGNTDRFGCESCKIKGDKYAMEDHNCSGSLKKSVKSKSRVADIAETNLSGKGIMPGDGQENREA